MDFTFVILVEMLYAVASLVLISAGLAVVFGMMKVIRLAHGEFMMMGGYATITAVGLGVNVFVAMLVIAPLVVGLIGLRKKAGLHLEGAPGLTQTSDVANSLRDVVAQEVRRALKGD